RMTPIGYALGLVSREQHQAVLDKYDAVERECRRLEHSGARPGPELTAFLTSHNQPDAPNGARLADLLRRPTVTYAELAVLDPERPALTPDVCQAVEIAVKYDGYIQRQMRQVEEMKRLDSRPLPADLDYGAIGGLRLEARQKLQRIRPMNLGQASRVSGVSPADIAVLMVWLKSEHTPEEER
ncbi:MAG: tRNA uridine-5-carboxymethylaminomethyl(34) synthesis enzyme MnmG, partial [Clostridium sp.]|nr:tRNA uridine-5-carboxymethylaminomethyl(34) synthesis enzyme MnmG [Clostridium sp.]